MLNVSFQNKKSDKKLQNCDNGDFALKRNEKEENDNNDNNVGI